jgi:hypothetical protein
MTVLHRGALKAAAAFAALLVAGCAHRPQTDVAASFDPLVAVNEAIAGAAARIQSCYRSPPVPSAARQIVTHLRVRYAIDGQPVGFPEVVLQESVTPRNRPYADVMAQAAVGAVLRCGPIRMPPELHSGGWDMFELTFSPRAIG